MGLLAVFAARGQQVLWVDQQYFLHSLGPRSRDFLGPEQGLAVELVTLSPARAAEVRCRQDLQLQAQDGQVGSGVAVGWAVILLHRAAAVPAHHRVVTLLR